MCNLNSPGLTIYFHVLMDGMGDFLCAVLLFCITKIKYNHVAPASILVDALTSLNRSICLFRTPLFVPAWFQVLSLPFRRVHSSGGLLVNWWQWGLLVGWVGGRWQMNNGILFQRLSYHYHPENICFSLFMKSMEMSAMVELPDSFFLLGSEVLTWRPYC